MTANATESRRKVGRPAKHPLVKFTFRSDFVAHLEAQVEAIDKVTFPSPKYREDPVGFAREVLGIDPWGRQVEILEAVRDHPSVAVSSGNKLGKSTTAVILALWFYASFPEARVVLSATTEQQVNEVLWRELSRLIRGSGRCIHCKAKLAELIDSGMSPLEAESHVPRPCPHSAIIDGQLGATARSGLRSDDHRQIIGVVVRTAESVSGVSGPNQLWIVDEASAVLQEFFDALEGNRAGGARLVMISNPTRTWGMFFDAFHSKREFFHCISVSTEETPNAQAGRVVIPGLATKPWIEEKRREWGEDSPLFKIRVKGEFAVSEDGKIFSIARIGEAEQRWAATPADGRLYVGIDPAGPTGSGDETALGVRRGHKHLSLDAHLGLSEDGILLNLLGLIQKHLDRRELAPVVVLDREGSVGAALYGRLRQYLDSNPRAFELVGLRASEKAIRNPQIYDRIRDELAANLDAWFRDGGAIVEDAKLSAELHYWQWHQGTNGRYKIQSKDDARKALGRSPDRYDALALSVWEPISLQEGIADQSKALQAQAAAEARRMADPYNRTVHAGGYDPYRNVYGRRS